MSIPPDAPRPPEVPGADQDTVAGSYLVHDYVMVPVHGLDDQARTRRCVKFHAKISLEDWPTVAKLYLNHVQQCITARDRSITPSTPRPLGRLLIGMTKKGTGVRLRNGNWLDLRRGNLVSGRQWLPVTLETSKSKQRWGYHGIQPSDYALHPKLGYGRRTSLNRGSGGSEQLRYACVRIFDELNRAEEEQRDAALGLDVEQRRAIANEVKKVIAGGRTIYDAAEGLSLPHDFLVRVCAEFDVETGPRRREPKERWYAVYASRRLGVYDTKEEAARAYDEVAWRERGEFATLNFPRVAN